MPTLPSRTELTRFAGALLCWFVLVIAAYLPLRAYHHQLGLVAACGVLWFWDEQLGMVLVEEHGGTQAIVGGCERERSIAVTRETLDLQLGGVVLLPALVLASGGVWGKRLARILRWLPALVLLQGGQLALAGWASLHRLQGSGQWAAKIEQVAGSGAWLLPLLLWGLLESVAPLGAWRQSALSPQSIATPPSGRRRGGAR